jgi:hypothetical protein
MWEIAHDLDRQSVTHAMTGAAAAALRSPSVTATPVTELWIDETVLAGDLFSAVGAEAAETGHNLLLLQARDDLPLAFRSRTVEGLWVVNPLRLYVDLRADPRRGREQADNLREEVIGF